MGKVIIDITMSLDGFVTGTNDGMGNGLGDGGMILMDWVFDARTEADNTFLVEEPMQTLGSCILGRRTFDIAESAWGDNPPFYGKVFVLTHRPHETITRGNATFIFVTDGMDSALKQAREAAGEDKIVALMGANVSQQYLKAGLVDEMEIHIANVLMGGGRPLFANIGDEIIRLERIRVVPTPAVTHIRYRVVR